MTILFLIHDLELQNKIEDELILQLKGNEYW